MKKNSIIKGYKYRSREFLKAFLSLSFSHQKTTKSRQALNEIFFNPQCKCAEVPLSAISKSMPPFSVAPLFFEYINSQVRINKMIKKHTVDYHPGPSVLNFPSNLYIPPWLVRNVHIYGVQITGECICESKN